MPRPPISRRSKSRRSATVSRRSASAPITASRCCRSEPAHDVVRGLPGDDGDEQARYLEATVRRGPRRLDLPAQRQPGRHRQIHLQARLDGAARRRMRAQLLRRELPVRAGRRLQHLPDRRRCLRPGRLARRRAVPDRIALAVPRAAASRACRRLPRLPPPSRTATVLGLSGRALAPRRGAAHRPSAAVAAGRRPARRLRHRQRAARPRSGPPTTPRSGASSPFS